MTSLDTVHIVGGVTFGAVGLLLFQYYALRSYLGYSLFFAEGRKKLGNTVLKISKQAWVAYGALVAFLVNLVFIGSIAFNESNWDQTKLSSLVGVLSLQLAYYIFQLGYVYFLTFQDKSKLIYVQILLGACAAFQIVSAIVAAIYANGYSQWLNAIVAGWTFTFDFLIHSFLPSFNVDSIKNYRMALFDKESSTGTEMSLNLF